MPKITPQPLTKPKAPTIFGHGRMRRRKRAEESSFVHPLAQMQQTIGNHAVGRIMQAKLQVGQPGDEYEQEADQVADKVMRMPEPDVQRQPKDEEEKNLRRQPREDEELQRAPLPEDEDQKLRRQSMEEDEKLQRVSKKGDEEEKLNRKPVKDEDEKSLQTKPASSHAPQVTPAVQAHIDGMRGGGNPLPASARAFYEPRFGYDFGDVRLHSDQRAAESARAVNARAFTVGHDIAFGAGEYSPGTFTGRRLLAHELTHVVQQTGLNNLRSGKNENGHINHSLTLNPSPVASAKLQRVIAIGGANLDDAGGITSAQAQNEIVTSHLADIVNNTAGDLLFTKSYRERLIRDTVRDMHEASTRFQYGSVAELARDVRQRVLVSLYMRQSQGRTRTRMGFSYPDRAGDGTAGVGPRVNEAALPYWGPVQDPGGEYYFDLSSTGEANAYQAIVALFAEQTNPHLRTLIHCDYLLSVLQYRAWAETIGPPTFNSAVQHGLVRPVLKWNGFTDMERPNLVPSPAFPFFTIENPLQRVSVTSEDDLIIGDHVVFYNHESYDALIAGVGGIWRLENAIVIDRRGGENRYQGHGYFSPVPKSRLLSGMIRQYNLHVTAAQRLTRAVDRARTSAQRAAAEAALHAAYPNVHKKVGGGGWEISGTGLCGDIVTRDLRPLTASEAPGLIDPCTGTILVSRPVHTSP